MAVRNLVEKFARAGLKLVLKDKSLGRVGRGRGVSEIVQIDIGRNVRGTRRDEWFEIFPGHPSNRIEVLNVDLKSNQLVLFVEEPARTFEVERNTWSLKAARRLEKQLKDSRTKYRKVKNTFYIEEKTSGDKRHFLMGVDERQLFIAQLRDPVSTVDAARRSLGSTVQFHEGKRKMTPGRQGEWFFVKATRQQEEEIERLISRNQTVIQLKKSIGEIHGGRRGGNPHTADEIVVVHGSQMSRPEGTNFPIRGRQVFIRGCVRHVDHKTVKYSRWHEVIANHEGATSSGSASGITWID